MRCPLRCCDQSASSGTIDNVRRQDKGDVWSIRSIPLKRNLRQHPSYLNISYSNILISLFSAVSSLKNRKQNIIFADALCHHPGHSRYMHSDIPRISAKGGPPVSTKCQSCLCGQQSTSFERQGDHFSPLLYPVQHVSLPCHPLSDAVWATPSFSVSVDAWRPWLCLPMFTLP